MNPALVETAMKLSENPELISTNTPSRRNKEMHHQDTSARDCPTDSTKNNTEDDRMLREEQESIELARQLMAEEAMASYHHHVESLRFGSENGQMSPEEDAIWRIAMQEEEREEAEEEEAVNELSYEGLLTLAENIGDVRSERWAMVAAEEIEKLPVCTFDPTSLADPSLADDSQHKCLVCQCEYDEGEQLRRLPCSHFFHQSCVDVWLQSKDFCPYCRSSIAS
jgi:hypothetical protein